MMPSESTILFNAKRKWLGLYTDSEKLENIPKRNQIFKLNYMLFDNLISLNINCLLFMGQKLWIWYTISSISDPCLKWPVKQ